MKRKIGFIAPTEELKNFVISVLGPRRDVSVVRGLVTEAHRIASQLVSEGAEVIIARSETARALKNAKGRVPIVEVPVTLSDLVSATESLKRHGRRIAVVCFPDMAFDLDWLGGALAVELRKYTVERVDDVEEAVRAAQKAGFCGVLGGGITVRAAKKHNIRSALIPMGLQAVELALLQASQISSAIDLVESKNTLITTLLDRAYEGILTVDEHGIVNMFNPAAEKWTGIPRSAALGSEISRLIPALDMKRLIRGGGGGSEHMIVLSDSKLVCNMSPLTVEERVIGAVAVFQGAARIEKLEAAIRQKVYNKGHAATYTFADVVGDSGTISETIDAAKDYAATDLSILIQGETGTGKEIFAQSIHNHTSRSCAPFVAINCASLPEQILESELFGYVAGAFTGASKEGKPGLFEIAHNGTIFLDEISEMDYQNQGRLLRFLQERTVRRLGSDRNIPVNVRIVAATNKPLEELVELKRFRDDLYYRLNVLSLVLPPLRERAEDIPTLVGRFASKYNARREHPAKFSRSAIGLMKQLEWKGNVRELEHLVARLVVTSKSVEIGPDQVAKATEARAASPTQTDKVSKIRSALAQAEGSVSDAAAVLGVNRSTLWRWMKRHRIS